MKKAALILLFLLSAAVFAEAGLLDDVMKGLDGGKQPAATAGAGLDDTTVVSGLKEALSVGTERAVSRVSQTDGYFGDALIRILMPEKIQKVADVLRSVGYEKQVDAFVLSMNRAAEAAAPRAAAFFGDAVREMTFDDARRILGGGDTAATEYFRGKTQDRIYAAFKPIVSSSLSEVGATKSYKDLMSKYESIPFMPKQSLDLDHYVTGKALDGLFTVVGQEEKKIRTDPLARGTDILKTVFGR